MRNEKGEEVDVVVSGGCDNGVLWLREVDEEIFEFEEIVGVLRGFEVMDMVTLVVGDIDIEVIFRDIDTDEIFKNNCASMLYFGKGDEPSIPSSEMVRGQSPNQLMRGGEVGGETPLRAQGLYKMGFPNLLEGYKCFQNV